MIIRLRSRDGLERIQLASGSADTLGGLRAAVETQLGVPIDQQRLSKQAALLTQPHTAELLQGAPETPLASLGVSHGDMLYLDYDMERKVEPSHKPDPFGSRPFGSRVTVADIVAKQRRIERQEKGTVGAVSFDRGAAQSFQAYISSALAFSIKRGGILYGSVGEDKVVRVEAVFEPPQSGTATELLLERGTQQEQQFDQLAELFGLKKVGWVFSQANTERDYIVSASEVQAMAAMQAEIGPQSVAVLVTWETNDHGGNVHFEAFQCSEQAVTLYTGGWFRPPGSSAAPAAAAAAAPKAQGSGSTGGGKSGDGGGDIGDIPPGVSLMRNPKEAGVETPVIVAGKDTDRVDSDWFLVALPILDHAGPLLSTFPAENRLLPQSGTSLREHLSRHAALSPYSARLADIHLLLWLAGQPGMEAPDMAAITAAARDRSELLEGYRVIIDSIAGV